MTNWRIWTGLAVLGLTLACGGDDDEPKGPQGTKIDCTWFSGDNCYKRALASVSSCLPAAGDQGTLTAAGDTCTYTSGHTITFNTPVNLSSTEDSRWDFDISSSAGQCVGYKETSTGLILKTPSGSFTEETKGVALQLTCPDGSQFYMENAFDTLSCDLGQLPGYVTSNSSSSVFFSFLGGTDGSVGAFSCKQ